MKFLIFGGTGFVGSDLQNYIEQNGEEAIIVSRSGKNGSLALDITNEEEFSKINFVPDVVVNCASRVPAKNKTSKNSSFLNDLFQTNVIGAANISNWAVKMKVPKLINCSTLVVVNKPWPVPLSEDHFALPSGYHVGYAMSKLSQEQIMNHCVEKSETELLHLRLSAVYGKEMAPEGLIFNLLEKASKNETIGLTDAHKNSIDLITVRDVSKTIFLIGANRHNSTKNIVNVASGNEVTIFQLAEIIKKVTNSSSEILNSSTSSPASRAKIDVAKLQEAIGEEYNNFLSLEEGLKLITTKYIRR